MANSNELKRLGERFPNKNIGSGNPSAKILVVTQRQGNEDVDFVYLKELFANLPDVENENFDVLKHCYYIESFILKGFIANIFLFSMHIRESSVSKFI